MTAPDPIARITLVGSGLEAWFAALYLRRALPPREVRIAVCPRGRNATDWLYATANPGFANALRHLGFNDPRLLKTCAATFRLGHRLSGFSGMPAPQPQPLGGIGVDWAGQAFHHHWTRARQGGSDADYFAFSPAARAMDRNAFAPPDPRNRMGDLQHEAGLHLDPALLLDQLRAAALQVGIGETDETGDADLVILTGADSPAGESEAWRAASLAHRFSVTASRDPRTGPTPPCSGLTARPDGWTRHIPLAAETLTITLNDAPAGGGDETAMMAGWHRQPWQENRLHLGAAAAALPALDGMAGELLLRQLGRLVALMPGRDNNPVETSEYNRLFVEDMEYLDGFNAVREAARRHGSLAEGVVDPEELPDSLAERLALFAARGTVSPDDSDILTDTDWAAAFIAHGALPRTYNLIAETIPLERLTAEIAQLGDTLERVVGEFPPHDAFLRALRGAAPQRMGA